MKIGNKMIYIVFMILISGCDNIERHVEMRTTKGNTLNEAQYYEIYYFKDSISLRLKQVSENEVNYKSRTFEKKNNKYYFKNSYPKELNNGRSYNLILCTQMDTGFSYSSAGNINKIEIRKIRESLYESTFQISGISNFKEIIYFNENYEILKVERNLQDKKYQFVLD